MPSQSRKYDVVVWGATGFTGGIVAEYFSSRVLPREKEFRFAIAGRNLSKLESISASLAARPDVLVGSAADAQSLSTIARQTKVVLSTVGPFLKYGSNLVAACVANGTDYCDITGETPWVRQMIDRYHKTAAENKTFVVPMCGFDSIPSDVGTLLTVLAIRRSFGRGTRRVKNIVSMTGQTSGGSLASGIEMDTRFPAAMKDPFLLGGRRQSKPRAEDKDVDSVRYSHEAKCWLAPFGMAKLNTRVVRRSTELFLLSGRADYGDLFAYQEYLALPSEKLAKKVLRNTQIPPQILQRLIKSGRLPKPGQGPSAEKRANNWFQMKLIGESECGGNAVTTVRGRDAGYDETAKMVAEAAVLLATQKSALLANTNGKGGVLTPAFAFGDKIAKILTEQGITFQTKILDTRAKL